MDAFTARFPDVTQADVLSVVGEGFLLAMALAVIGWYLTRPVPPEVHTPSEWHSGQNRERVLHAIVKGTSERRVRAGYQAGRDYSNGDAA